MNISSFAMLGFSLPLQIQQLFDSPPHAHGLPDIALRPDSAAMEPRVRSAPSRSLSLSSAVPMKISFPMTPAQAVEKYKRVLTSFEQTEIMDFPQVYFLGPLAKKVSAGEGKGPNFGYDDDKGRYKLVKNDHIGYRFEVLKGLGKGSFGEVVRTFDHKTQQHFALKIIRNERRFHKQAQIEIKILEHLKKEDKKDQYHLIHMAEWFVFRDHICITFELLHCDLYSALKNDSFRGFGMPDVQSMAASLLTCMRMLKRNHIIHCDLKPENILLCKKDGVDVKVIDFGSACYDNQKIHTYIQSRFYRSPEVILGGSYSVAIDMWSLGCILVELLTGQPLFPGHDEKEQLLYQMEMLGLPAKSLLEKCKRVSVFFDEEGQPRVLSDHKGRRRVPDTRPLSRVLGRAEPEFEDFVMQCLRWDPEERISPRDAMKHPWVARMLATPKLGRSVSEANAGSRSNTDDALVPATHALALGPASHASATYVLPPVQLARPAPHSGPIPAALLPRQSSTSTNMTSDQLAHAERLRSAGQVRQDGGAVRRLSLSREKAAS